MPGELSTKALLDGNFQVVVRDVTDRKNAQAQVLLADRMSSLGRLASGVAHGINNPLAYVMLNLEFLAKRLAGLAAVAPPTTLEEMSAALEHSREGTERMRQIVRALSDFGRGDEERVGAVDINSVLESVGGDRGHAAPTPDARHPPLRSRRLRPRERLPARARSSSTCW